MNECSFGSNRIELWLEHRKKKLMTVFWIECRKKHSRKKGPPGKKSPDEKSLEKRSLVAFLYVCKDALIIFWCLRVRELVSID